MRSWTHLILLLAIAMSAILPSNTALAGQGDWINGELFNEELIYSATKEACSRTPRENLYGGLAYDNLYAGIFPSERFSQMIMHIVHEEFAKSTVFLLEGPDNENELWLLNSVSFNKAIQECYPNTKDQKQFKWLVSIRKRAGAFAGIFTSFAIFGGATAIVGRFSATLAAFINYGALASAGGLITYDIVSKLLKRSEVVNKCGEPATIDCLMGVLAGLPDGEKVRQDLESSLTSDLASVNLDTVSEGERQVILELRSELGIR